MKYGWFSPIKGTYPGLAQEDKTAPFKGDVDDLARGTIVVYNTDGTFSVADTADVEKDLYIALQDGYDRQAEFAGSSWYLGTAASSYADVVANPNLPAKSPLPHTGAKRGPAITALSLRMSGEYQTTEFKPDVGLVIGAHLTIDDGQLALAGASDPFIGIVTKAPTDRYLNDAPIAGLEDRNQGAMKSVLQFRTAV